VKMRNHIGIVVGALALVAAAPAFAQEDVPIGDPAADIPVYGDQPADYGAPAMQPAPSQGLPPGTAPAPAESEGFYIPSDEEPEETSPSYTGNVPETHVVRKGDTLWDLCAYYFNDPWRWPKIWSYNPTITNPHWIYPGDLVRLFGAGEAPEPRAITRIAPSESPGMAFQEPSTGTSVELRQLAFMDAEQLKFSGEIVGSVEDKMLLTTGDEIFIEYANGKPPQVSKRYAIYTPTEEVDHPEGGGKVGAYVLLRGEVQIVEVKKDKKARGIITYVTGTVERGYKVGPLKTQFKDVEPVVAAKNLEGVIIAILDVDQLIGAGAVVFLDRGKDDGVKIGNRFVVVRRGDAYDADHALPEGGRDDRKYPEENIAEVMVVDVGSKSSVGLVTSSLKEALIGDHVVMRKGR
jgi:hypothetical protein